VTIAEPMTAHATPPPRQPRAGDRDRGRVTRDITGCGPALKARRGSGDGAAVGGGRHRSDHRPAGAIRTQPASSAGSNRVREISQMLSRRAGLSARHPGRQTLRREALEAGLPFARRLAARYAGRGVPLDDLGQVAVIGLIKAVDGFDPARGTDFASYAAPTINGELKRYFRNQSWSVHVPRRLQQLWLDINGCHDELTQRLRRHPSAADLADHLGTDEEAVIQALAAAEAHHAASLYGPVAGSPELTVLDQVGDVDPGYDRVEFRASIRPALSTLSPRDQHILAMRFFANMTQAQIAAEIGVCQVHVSRLIGRSLRRLRTALGYG
jgi:RNA polymerase sigma-B factor